MQTRVQLPAWELFISFSYQHTLSRSPFRSPVEAYQLPILNGPLIIHPAYNGAIRISASLPRSPSPEGEFSTLLCLYFGRQAVLHSWFLQLGFLHSCVSARMTGVCEEPFRHLLQHICLMRSCATRFPHPPRPKHINRSSPQHI